MLERSLVEEDDDVVQQRQCLHFKRKCVEGTTGRVAGRKSAQECSTNIYQHGEIGQ